MKIDQAQPTRIRVIRNNILVASRTDNFSSREEVRSWVNKELRHRFPNKKVRVDLINADFLVSWNQIVS